MKQQLDYGRMLPADTSSYFSYFAQSSSASRRTAGASGFLNFSQSCDRPEWLRDPSRLDTIPSKPILQACWNTASLSGCSRCSLRRNAGAGFAQDAGCACPASVADLSVKKLRVPVLRDTESAIAWTQA